MSRLAPVAALLLLLAGPARALKIERLSGVLAVGKPMEVVAGQVLVRFSSGTSTAQKAAAAAIVGGAVGQDIPGTGWTVVSLSSGMSVLAGLSALKAAPGVQNLQANHVYRTNVVPDDPLVQQQYALQEVNAFAGWEFETGSSNKVTIAMIDAGVDGTHPDLSPKLANTVSQDCSSGTCSTENPPHPACDHGTRTSGVAGAAGDNGIGIAGMSWGAQLVSLKVFADADCPSSDCSDDTCGASDAAIAAAINKAIALNNTASIGRVVINMSLGASGLPCGGTGCPGGPDCMAMTQTAISNAVAANIPLAISAGNDSGAVNSPANCAGTTGGSGIIPVGAVDSSNNIAYFSSNGPELAANGVCAPGVDVETTDIGDGYTGSATGTSFAAPHVAGLAALILSKKPTATAAQVQAWIQAGADNIGAPSAQQGAGRIDVFRTLRFTTNGTLADYQGDEKAIAFPNPFRLNQTGNATISVPVSLQGGDTTIKIYTLDGQLVRQLGSESWDGRNDAGALVASGTYIFLVKTDKGSTRGRIAVIR